MKSRTLYKKEGSADKYYRVALEPDGAKHFKVYAQFGRRGSAPQLFAPEPWQQLTLAEAEEVYEAALAKKLRDRYKDGEDAGAVQVPATSGAGTDVMDAILASLPDHMLVSNMSEDEANGMLGNQEWVAQIKHNGHRVRVIVHKGEVRGISRRNLPKALPMVIVEYLASKFSDSTTIVVDGELVGDEFIVFDLLYLQRHLPEILRPVKPPDPNIWQRPAFDRIALFEGIFPIPKKGKSKPPVFATVTARGRQAKAELWLTAKKFGEEGFVCKRNVPYTPGRSTNGPVRKFKFLNSVTVICDGRTNERSKTTGEDKRSVNVKFYRGRNLGHVSIPVNKEIPAKGTPIEVSYQDVLEDGHLYVTVFLGVRDDIPVTDCTEAKQKLYVRGTARD